MNNPLVSIIMTAYNEELYIKEAIESVLAQTYTDFEFIIVNDGSIDQTESIILSFSDDRIKYVKNEHNLKLIDSLNIGLNLAKGKYIARMDSDDLCMPERLEKQIEFMEANPEIGISGAQLIVFGSHDGFMNYPLTHDDIRLKLFISSCFGNNVVMFRRVIFEKNQLFFPLGYFHAEDFKCWTNWMSVTKAANLNLYLVKYRSHANSVSSKHKLIQRETRNRIRLEYVKTTFSLENDLKTAVDFTGKISSARVNAIKTIFKINEEKKHFDVLKLKKTVMKLWYLDSLEEVENNFFVILKYPLIFKIDLKSNFKNWINIVKHFLKFKLAGK
ncbi:MAG: glycosyltransferase family 2 protein [Burkholderiales bacterium]|nr:glycosyltransferase family 2 protein [Bacteroidia bacterium]